MKFEWVIIPLLLCFVTTSEIAVQLEEDNGASEYNEDNRASKYNEDNRASEYNEDNGASEYNEAIKRLQKVEQTYTRHYIFTADNIENNLYIPQYDASIKDYKTDDDTTTTAKPPLAALVKDIIPLLEKSASKNNLEASRTLGDFYMFGNFSFPVDYKQAKYYYDKTISIGPDGHAYFMLGFIYSTGLFGEFGVDQAKGNLYYQFAMENGDMNALLVLAYRHLKGICVPLNCELAVPYYAKLANIGIEWFQNKSHIREVDYNIRISDFNGGLFGDKLSETGSSIEIRSRIFADLKQTFEESKINANDHEYVSLYYSGMEHFKGDYFVEKNLTKAFNEFKRCVDLGEEIFGANDYTNMVQLDRLYLSSCQAILGRMYFKGLSVPQDVEKAEHYYNISIKVQATPEALNDLAIIEEKGLLRTANYTRAIELYAAAIKNKSAEANKNLAKLLIKISGGDPKSSEHRSDIYRSMKEAAYSGNTEALYYMGEFFESGLPLISDSDDKPTCSKTAMYYREFVRRLSPFFAPHLKYAFEELKSGNYKNSLIGYSIAAEQGFEAAQISAAYLLYQQQPLSQSLKSFSSERVKIAVHYLECASKQANVDATVLLGILLAGEDPKAQMKVDYERAFNYFRLATDRHSSHGAYKLAEMYEYGLGPTNNTVDYFLAKRYYDQSLQYREKIEYERQLPTSKLSYTKVHISWALLRLRFKYLFNRKAFNSSIDETSADGWLSAFKKIGKKSSSTEATEERKDSPSRADAHHQGTPHETDYVENYDIGDYLVISLTFLFFSIFFLQNIIRQVRRARQGPRPANQNAGGAEDNVEQNWGWNGMEVNFRRGNFEFHFFAI
ncbi:HRD3 [Candida oxycetoniae]|uniref:HRD3 n=1 Tax=Candida oxycetoniae TaxID=497107 RepID=A0AAI9X0I0_9ASCO|nr:HRD3 [Candida oxycetoniae]KAI3407090.2 HRD3 [Candida oxycetoniae]